MVSDTHKCRNFQHEFSQVEVNHVKPLEEVGHRAREIPFQLSSTAGIGSSNESIGGWKSNDRS